MKQITIAGRLGKSAELRRTRDGTPVLGFSVAVDDGYGENKSTLWFDVSVWGKRGEVLERYLTNGMAVAVSGDLTRNDKDGKTYIGVRASEITMLGGGDRQDRPAKKHEPTQPDLDDEIPF